MRYKLEYAGLKLYLGALALMPPPVASAVSGGIFGTIGPLMGISRVGRNNLARVFPHWTRTQVNHTLRKMWVHLGRVIGEYPHLEAIAKNYTTFRNGERFSARVGQGATLFVSGHIGNWEVLPPAMLYQIGLPMHSAYRAPNNPLVDEMLVNFRSSGGKLRSFGKTRKGLAEILRALQGGECVGMLIDQKMNTGIEAPFFGRSAMTSTAFVELARKVGCPLIPGQIIRTKGCHFEINLGEPIAVGERPTQDIVADTHAVLEGWIKDHPEQWLWIHRRWKKDT
jgi:KDO2-lipid IV(A) lauroyltransferase